MTERTFFDKFTESKSAYLIIGLVAFAIYIPTLFFGFVGLDDKDIIIDNYKSISELSSVWNSFSTDAYSNSLSPYYRPLLTASFALNAQIGGQEPFIYHLTNILLHTLFCCLLFLLLTKLKLNRKLSFLSVLLFAVHPLFINAVAWIVARNDVMAGLFFVLSFIFLIRFVEQGGIGAFIWHSLFFIISIFSKESALAAPFVFAYYLLFIIKQPLFSKKYLHFLSIWVLAPIVFLILRQKVIHPGAGNIKFGFNYFISNLQTLPEMLAKFFIPYKITGLPKYSFDLTLIGLAIIAILIYYIMKSKPERKYLYFGIFIFLLFIISGLFTAIVSVNEWFDYLECRAYIPAVGIIIFLITLFGKFYPKGQIRKAALILPLVLVVLLGSLNIIKSREYSDILSFYDGVLSINPKFAMAYNNRGMAKKFRGQTREAIDDFNEAIRLNPKFSVAYYNRATAKIDLGNYQRVKEDLDTAIFLEPEFAKAYYNRGLAKINLQDTAGAIKDWTYAAYLGHDKAKGIIYQYQQKK